VLGRHGELVGGFRAARSARGHVLADAVDEGVAVELGRERGLPVQRGARRLDRRTPRTGG
jgi:hypothetical protein